MVVAISPPPFELKKHHIQQAELFESSKIIQLRHEQLQQHPTFIAIKQSLQQLFEQYQQAQQADLLNDIDKAKLIQAWQDYCRDMLAFVRHLKESRKREGADTTFQLGQLYLKQLIKPYTQLASQDFAHYHDDPQLQIQQLIYHPNNLEVLSLDKLLRALEKYYQTHQTLIDHLEQYAKLGQKLAKYDFRTLSAHAYQQQKVAFETDFHQFTQTLHQLQTTRAALAKQVQRFEKRFSLFLLGPIFKLFWGQQQKMCQVVMSTVDARINQISDEVAHHLSAQGSRYLSFHAEAEQRDPTAGSKMLLLNKKLHVLTQVHPSDEVNDARQQLADACKLFINTQGKAPSLIANARATLLAASCQDELQLSTDTRQQCRDAKSAAEATAGELLKGAQLYGNAANEFYLKHHSFESARRYRFQTELLTVMRAWQPYCDVDAIQSLDLDLPNTKQLHEHFEHLLTTGDLLQQPVERLVCCRRFGNFQQRRALTEKIQTFIERYLACAYTPQDSQRALAAIYRAGMPEQQYQLEQYFKRWSSQTLLAKADDKAELESAIDTLLAAETYSEMNGQYDQRNHYQQLITQLPTTALTALSQCSTKDQQTLARIRNLLEACLTHKLNRRCQQPITEAFCLDAIYRYGHFEREISPSTWNTATAVAMLLSSYPTPLPRDIARLEKLFRDKIQSITNHLVNLALQHDFQQLNHLNSCYHPHFNVLISYARHGKNQPLVYQSRQDLPGSLLLAQFQRHWQQFIDEANQDDALLQQNLHQCYVFLNELLRQTHEVPRQFIYPQHKQVLEFFTELKPVLTRDPLPADAQQDNDINYIKERKIGFLEEITHQQSRYPHLAGQVSWQQALDHYWYQGEVAVITDDNIQRLREFYRYLNKVDVLRDQPFAEGPPAYAPANEKYLFYSLWHGLMDKSQPTYHQSALQVTSKLIKLAQHYLAEYEMTKTVARWSPEHKAIFQHCMQFIAVLHHDREQLKLPKLAQLLEQLYQQTQRVSQLELLVTIFKEIVPEEWRQHWQPFSDYNALDRRSQRLGFLSPLKNGEVRLVQKLSEQLLYLTSGEGNGHFDDLFRWKTVKAKVLNKTFDQVQQLIQQRQQQSEDHLRELQHMQQVCAQPPVVDLQHERKNNSAAVVAGQLENQLLEWVARIKFCLAGDVAKLSQPEATDVNDKAKRLFVERIAFLYHVRDCLPDKMATLKQATEGWLVDEFSQLIETHAEAMQRLMTTFSEDLLEKLIECKPEEAKMATDNFWKLVDYVHKSRSASQLDQYAAEGEPQNNAQKAKVNRKLF